MAKRQIDSYTLSAILVAAATVLVGIAGCSRHKSTCYDGDCGLVYDNDYWQSESGCGGCGAPVSHGSGCGGCGTPLAHAGCSHPHPVSTSCSGCGAPHHHPPTCSSCGGVHEQPAPVTKQPGCPHCGDDHGAVIEDASPTEAAPATPSPAPPALPSTIPDNPGDTPRPEKSDAGPQRPAADTTPTAGTVPPPLETQPAGLEPAPPGQPVELPGPALETPAPIPRDATQPRWIPRRF